MTDDRAAWAAQMRLKFSPKGMIDSDGAVIQDFFKPKAVYLVSERRCMGKEDSSSILQQQLEQQPAMAELETARRDPPSVEIQTGNDAPESVHA